MSLTGVLCGMLGAASAVGVPELPANQELFALDCGSHRTQLWGVDSALGDSIPVNTVAPSTDCPNGAQQNPVDGKVYVLVKAGVTNYLATVDMTSGGMSKIAEIFGPANPWKILITTTGDAYLTSDTDLYSLNLANAATTLVGNFATNYFAASYNPVDDTIYLYTYATGLAYSLDRTNATATASPAHNIILSPWYTCPNGSNKILALMDVAFDARGTLWLDSNGCNSELLVADATTGVVSYRGQLNDASRTLYSSPYYDYYTQAMFITTDSPSPTPPALARTGFDSYLSTGLATLAACSVLMGAHIVALARRARRARLR